MTSQPKQLDEEPPEGGGGAPAWMVTYADMVTLLMTFFVLLLSFANTDMTKFREMMGSVKEAFGVDSETPGFHVAHIVYKPQLVIDEDLADIYREMAGSLSRAADATGLSESMEVSAEGQGVIMRMEGGLLYGPASSAMAAEARNTLGKLATMINEVYLESMVLMVEGHTDSTVIKSELYPSNWELSSARAAGALRTLLEAGVPGERVAAVGYGATRPIASNASEIGRARNRRVEFRLVIASDEAAQTLAGGTLQDASKDASKGATD